MVGTRQGWETHEAFGCSASHTADIRRWHDLVNALFLKQMIELDVFQFCCVIIQRITRPTISFHLYPLIHLFARFASPVLFWYYTIQPHLKNWSFTIHCLCFCKPGLPGRICWLLCDNNVFRLGLDRLDAMNYKKNKHLNGSEHFASFWMFLNVTWAYTWACFGLADSTLEVQIDWAFWCR